MSQIVGGLRARLIKESLYQMINGSLDALTWFDTNRLHSPVTFRAEEVPNLEEIPVNTAVLVDFDDRGTEMELGSNLTEFKWRFYVDFYGETSSVSLHFSRDIRDILEGRMPSIGRSRPDFVVYDYQQATPNEIFVCQIEDVLLDRPGTLSKEYQRFWYTVRFDVVDTYLDELS